MLRASAVLFVLRAFRDPACACHRMRVLRVVSFGGACCELPGPMGQRHLLLSVARLGRLASDLSSGRVPPTDRCPSES
jgi:hypothetical protein